MWGFVAAADEDFSDELEVVVRHDATLVETGINEVDFSGHKFKVYDYDLTGRMTTRTLSRKPLSKSTLLLAPK